MKSVHSILIVEDNTFLANTLQKNLVSQWHRVLIATSLKSAYQKLDHTNFDLIILDRVLGDGEGLEIIPFVRSSSSKTKILVLSDKSRVDERITGLSQGADDYLAKPFSYVELKLRVGHLLSVEKIPANEALELATAKFYPQLGRLESPSGAVQLRRRESQILSCLLRRKNVVVTKNALIKYVWGTQDPPATSTIDVYVRRLRMAVKDCLTIKTVRGYGYLVTQPAG